MTAPNPITAYRQALEEIASASPSLHHHHSGEHRCTTCHALIDTARAVLGYAEWPAQPKTKKTKAP